jgi:hypothetical protein
MEPQLHWKVPFEAGFYENSPKWSNKGRALDNLALSPSIVLLLTL